MPRTPPPHKARRRFTYRELAEITARMTRGKFTVRQIQRSTGVSNTSARNWTTALHDAGCIHIVEYARTINNRIGAAVYQWGNGDDAPYPKAMTALERDRRSKAKKQRLDGWKGVRPCGSP